MSSTTDEQDSLTLDPAVLATGFFTDGQQDAAPGQAASLTSQNNFINFCKGTGLPIANGTQVKTGFCNPAPMGVLAAASNMPACKFQYPPNFDTSIKPDQPFTVQLAVQQFSTGNNVNAALNYLAAPQQVDANGDVIGHTKIVIEPIDSFLSTTPTDPTRFVFMLGTSDHAVNGVLKIAINGGLPEGFYRMSTMNVAANGQPVLVNVHQHGAIDDTIYFAVGKSASDIGFSLPPANSSTDSSVITTASSTTTSGAAIITSAVVKPSAPQKQSGLAPGAIVGIAVAGLAVVALLVAVVFIMRRRSRRKNVDDTIRGVEPSRYSRETPGYLVQLPNASTALVWNDQMPVSAVSKSSPASASTEQVPRSEKRRALDRAVVSRTTDAAGPDSSPSITTYLDDETNSEGRTAIPVVSAEMHHLLRRAESLRTQAAPDGVQMAELRERLEALAPPEEVLRALQDIFQRRNEGIGDLPEYDEGNRRR